MRCVLAAALLVAACGGGGGQPDAALPDAVVPDAMPLLPTTQLDLLFVVDNSGTAWELNLNTAHGFYGFTRRLRARFGGELPDIHLAVTTGHMWAGGHDTSGCSGVGDDGRFVTVPEWPNCTLPDGLWLEDAPDGQGGRLRNYGGSLERMFGCIAMQNTDGCTFQQHLGALERALDGTHPEHEGFMRLDAVLAIVIVADDDDCTAEDPAALYDPDPEAGFGPLSSYRCAEQGWLCNGEPLPPMEATYQDCTVRTDGALTDVQATVTFLRSLKDDPRRVVLGGVMADREPVVVIVNSETGEPRHDNICPVTTDTGYPHSTNIRDRAVVDEMGGVWVDGCLEVLSPGMAAIADQIADRMVAPTP